MRYFNLTILFVFMLSGNLSFGGRLSFMGCCGGRPEQNIQARFILFMYRLNEKLSSHTYGDGGVEYHSLSPQEGEMKYRILVGYCLEDYDDGDPAAYKFACNIDMSNECAQNDPKVAKSLFEKTPKELPSKVKEDFKRGNVDSVFVGVKELYGRRVNRCHFKNMILGIKNKDNQKILFKGKGPLSDQEITDLKDRGVVFDISKSKELELFGKFKKIIKSRSSAEDANDSDGLQLLYDGSDYFSDTDNFPLKVKGSNTDNSQLPLDQADESV